MKKYRLIKELPWLEAGSIILLESGELKVEGKNLLSDVSLKSLELIVELIERADKEWVEEVLEISKDDLEEILDSIYILEEFDEANQDGCPSNAAEEVINKINETLKEKWISLEAKVIGAEYSKNVWEYIAEEHEEGSQIVSEYKEGYLYSAH